MYFLPATKCAISSFSAGTLNTKRHNRERRAEAYTWSCWFVNRLLLLFTFMEVGIAAHLAWVHILGHWRCFLGRGETARNCISYFTPPRISHDTTLAWPNECGCSGQSHWAEGKSEKQVRRRHLVMMYLKNCCVCLEPGCCSECRCSQGAAEGDLGCCRCLASACTALPLPAAFELCSNPSPEIHRACNAYLAG